MRDTSSNHRNPLLDYNGSTTEVKESELLLF